jgi:hypothetical protein
MSKQDDEEKAGRDLVLQLVQANADALNATNARLIENYKEQAELAQAELKAIREQIYMLLDGPYMPSAHMIERALMPSEEHVNRCREAKDW